MSTPTSWMAEPVALVTGAASGLGAATARVFVSAHWQVVALDLDTGRGDALASEIGEHCHYVDGDVTHPVHVDGAIDVATDLGELRCVVNCAGIGTGQPVVDEEGRPFDIEIFRKLFDVNVIGTVLVMSRAAAAMVRNGRGPDNERGTIVNVSSIAAFGGSAHTVAYSATKGAVAAMTLPAARDLAHHGIRVCCIAPGAFDTPMAGATDDMGRAALAEGNCFPRRPGNPEEFATLVLLIASNTYMNGCVLRIDAGARL